MEEYFVHFQLLRVEDEQNTLQTPAKINTNLVYHGNDARVQQEFGLEADVVQDPQRSEVRRAPPPPPKSLVSPLLLGPATPPPPPSSLLITRVSHLKNI